MEHYGARLLERGDRKLQIAGWSMGGVIAWELARWLDARGVEVGPVLAIDAHPVLPPSDLVAEWIGVLAGELRVAPALVAKGVLEGEWSPVSQALDGWPADELMLLATDVKQNLERIRGHALSAAWRPLILVEAARRDAGLVAPRESWEEAGASSMTVTVVDADHFDIVESPHAKTVAALIAR